MPDDKEFKIKISTTATGDGAEQLREQIVALEAEIKKLNEIAGPGGGSEAFQVKNIAPRVEELEKLRAKLAEIEAQAGKTGAAAAAMGVKVAAAANQGIGGFNVMSFSMGLLMAHWRRGVHEVWKLGTAMGKAIFRPPDWEGAQKDADKMAKEFIKIREEVLKVNLEIDRAFEATRKAKNETQEWLDKLHATNKAMDERDARKKKVGDSAFDKEMAENEASGRGPVAMELKKQEIEKREREFNFAEENKTMERERSAAIIDREKSKRMLEEKEQENGAGAKGILNAQNAIEAARAADSENRQQAAEKFAKWVKYNGEHGIDSLLYKEETKKEYLALHAKVKASSAAVDALMGAHPELDKTNSLGTEKDRVEDAKKLAEAAKSEEIKQINELKSEVEKARELAKKLTADMKAAADIHGNSEGAHKARDLKSLDDARAKEAADSAREEKKEESTKAKGIRGNEKSVREAEKALKQIDSEEKKSVGDVKKKISELVHILEKEKSAPDYHAKAGVLTNLSRALDTNSKDEKALNQLGTIMNKYHGSEVSPMGEVISLMQKSLGTAHDQIGISKTLKAQLDAVVKEVASLKSQVDSHAASN